MSLTPSGVGTPGQVCAGRDVCTTCVALTPLFALSGVAEMPDNEVLSCTKLPCAGEKAGLALKPVGHRPPPYNLCAVAGWSGLPGRARACLPLQVTASACWLQHRGCGPDVRPSELSLLPACSGRIKGVCPSSSRDLLTQLMVPVLGGGNTTDLQILSFPLRSPRLSQLGLLLPEGSWPLS